MKVLIVAKTRRGSGACVGGITEEGRSVRLVASDAATNEHAGLEYNVGEVWEIESAPDPEIVPPHVENVIVLRARRERHSQKVTATIHRFMPPVAGGPEQLFDGLVQATPPGGLYISQRGGLPHRSTMFWTPDQSLRLDCEGKRIRYRYPTRDGGRTLTFVGFQEPMAEIPLGTLLRVSLAHWWRPQDRPDEELRCFVQLSGWFLGAGAGDQDPQRSLAAGSGSALPSPPEKLGTASQPDLAARATEALKRTFGFSAFLPLQGDIVRRVLGRQDTLAVMPTGGGKSLCYQLPALLLEGLTVVVSPLVALMQDQIHQLRQMGVLAACLNHLVPLRDYQQIMRGARRAHFKLLYLAPETLLRPEIQLLLDQSRLACLAVDEAHCISEWGHDFRPEYRQLASVRRRFPTAVCIALTATATARVREDIRRLLGIPVAGEFVASFNRPNLFLAVEPRHDCLAQLLAFLEKHRGQSGIIYCGTRKQADRLCGDLTANGWPALPYHAGMPGVERQRNQDRFLHDDAPLMVATVAFGMGINKSNVRFVVHAHLPKDLESYYQEIGRAGRDGLPAHCLLLYSRRDASVHRHFIREGAASEREGREARLRAVMALAETPGCRRQPLLAYFGEVLSQPCGGCDNCAPAPRQHDTATPAAPAQAHDAELFQKLRELRKALAARASVPAYVIFSDRALLEMAKLLPQDRTQFLAINGVGQVKLGAYGDEFLHVIRAHAAQRDPAPGPQATAAKPRRVIRTGSGRRAREIGELFAGGQGIAQIAARYGIRAETVTQHLYRFLKSGGRIDAKRVLAASRLPEAQRARVLDAFARLGVERLAPVYSALSGAVSYAELHLLRLYWLCRERP